MHKSYQQPIFLTVLSHLFCISVVRSKCFCVYKKVEFGKEKLNDSDALPQRKGKRKGRYRQLETVRLQRETREGKAFFFFVGVGRGQASS